MSKQDRTTLKAYFRQGALPTAEHFSDLIDSAVNHVEDGFDKTSGDGLRLNSEGGSLRVMSLYEGLGAPDPSWTLDHGDENPGALHLRPGPKRKLTSGTVADDLSGPRSSEDGDETGLTLNDRGQVGISQPFPAWPLDVGGGVRSQGRFGLETHHIPHVPADGRWHDISQPMTGCNAFEVVAGTGGKQGHGRYSLVYAIAMNAYHPGNWLMNWFFRRRQIKAQTAVYGSYADRLRLRWVRVPDQVHHYKLQIRTNADFGAGRVIRYGLSQLWFDPAMTGADEAAKS